MRKALTKLQKYVKLPLPINFQEDLDALNALVPLKTASKQLLIEAEIRGVRHYNQGLSCPLCP